MSRPKPSERGFILIGALWLLVLSGAIVAILMLRSVSAAHATAEKGSQLRDSAAAEAAIDTVSASILMEGRNSRWAMTPASGTVEVDGVPVTIRVTSEAGRIDLNEYPLPKLGLALQALGVNAAARRRISDSLAARRAANKPLQSMAEVDSLLRGDATIPGDQCLVNEFTIFSGASGPNPGQMSPKLAAALADPTSPHVSASPQLVGSGAILRMDARAAVGTEIMSVLRTTGVQQSPTSQSSWTRSGGC